MQLFYLIDFAARPRGKEKVVCMCLCVCVWRVVLGRGEVRGVGRESLRRGERFLH